MDDCVLVTVEVDAFEESDEEELDLETFFLCGMNMRDTSSALIEFRLPFAVFLSFQGPSRGSDWKFDGLATAVVITVVVVMGDKVLKFSRSRNRLTAKIPCRWC